MKKVYLAIPYSFNPELSFSIANKVAAQLMQQGNVVFSPISHSHPVAEFLPPNLKTDSHWWMNQDLPLVEWCDEVCCVVIGEEGHHLIESSTGVQRELFHAKKNNKDITLFEYYS